MDPATAAFLANLALIGDSQAVQMNYYANIQAQDARGGYGVETKWEGSIDAWVTKNHTVIVMLGSNDAYNYLGGVLTQRVTEIARYYGRRAKQVVWFGPPCSWLAQKYPYLPKIDQVIEEAILDLKMPNVRYVSLFPLTAPRGTCLRDKYRSVDGIHFSPEGYANLAAFVIKTVGPK